MKLVYMLCVLLLIKRNIQNLLFLFVSAYAIKRKYTSILRLKGITDYLQYTMKVNNNQFVQSVLIKH